MKLLAELLTLTKGATREAYADYDDWEAAVFEAGAIPFTKADGVVGAMSQDGECGEFDKDEETGWLFEAARELWPVHSSGSAVIKKFAKVDGDWEKPAQVKAWMKTSVSPGDKMVWDDHMGVWKEDPKVTDREIKKQNRKWAQQDREEARANKKPKLDLAKIYRIVIDSVGNSFPDGDPIDSIAPKLENQFGLEGYEVGDAIEAAMKKHGHGSEKKGLTAYMADMWDQMADDAMYDAKEFNDPREPFIRMVDGKPEKADNPWK